MDRTLRAARIRRLAQRQRMFIATQQLQTLGLTEQGRRSAVRQGRLIRRCRGVYALPGAGQAWEDDVLMTLLAVGARTVASFDTARRLWLPDDAVGEARPTIDVTGPRLVRRTGVITSQQNAQLVVPAVGTRTPA